MDELVVKEALRELEAARQEDYPVEFIKSCLREFARLKWSTEKIVRKINEHKYRGSPYKTKFADFVEGETILNYWLIEKRAEDLLLAKKVVPLRKYQELNNALAACEDTLKARDSSPEAVPDPVDNRKINDTVENVRDIFGKAIMTVMYDVGSDKEKAIKLSETIIQLAKSEIDYYTEKLKG